MSGDDLRGIQDPLFARVNRPEKRKASGADDSGGDKSRNTPPKRQGSGGGGGSKALLWVGGIAVAAVLIFFGYSLYQSQQRIEQLSTALVESRTDLESVSEELKSSKGTIDELQTDLNGSKSALEKTSTELKQTKGAVSNLKNQAEGLKAEQEQQSRDLQAINLQKADRSQVESLEGTTQQIQQEVGAAKTKIASLDETAAGNRAAIESTRSDLSTVRSRTESTASDLASFKGTFAREKYDFELEKKGATMQLVGVSLALRKTDQKNQRFELDIIADGKRIRKSKQNINEPIVFYTDDEKKPYEIVVTKVGKDFVVGYLTVPKKDKSASVTG